MRDHVVVHEGKIGSLRRFKDDVSEVKSGFECGIGFDRFNDLKLGDVIEVFAMERVADSCVVKRHDGRAPPIVESHIPGARFLKDKRLPPRRIEDRLKKCHVAVSEVERHDLGSARPATDQPSA